MKTTLRLKGQIKNWKDDRGFGFIKPNDGGDDVFVHVSAFTNRNRRPIGNEAVTYQMVTDSQGREQAGRVLFAGDKKGKSTSTTNPVVYAFASAAAFMAFVTGLVFAGNLPSLVLTLYVSASIIAFIAYAWDKSAAKNERRRTAENTLHLLGIFGGWPGALVSRHIFRHKTQKGSFIIVFWATVLLNNVALGWLLSPPGQSFLASILATL